MSYIQAVHVAESCWGPDHGMTQTLRASLLDFTKKHRTLCSGGNKTTKLRENGRMSEQNGSKLSPRTAFKPGPVPSSSEKRAAENRHGESNPPSPRGLRTQRWLTDGKRRADARGLGRTPETPWKALVKNGPGTYPGRAWSKNPVGQRGRLIQRWANRKGLATSPKPPAAKAARSPDSEPSRLVRERPTTVAGSRRRVPPERRSYAADIQANTAERAERGMRSPCRDPNAERASLFSSVDRSFRFGGRMKSCGDGETPRAKLNLQLNDEEMELLEDCLETETESESDTKRPRVLEEGMFDARPMTAAASDFRPTDPFYANGKLAESRTIAGCSGPTVDTSMVSRLPRRPKTAPSGEASKIAVGASCNSVGLTWTGFQVKGARRRKGRSLGGLPLQGRRHESAGDEFPSRPPPSVPALQKFLGRAHAESIFDARPSGAPVKENDYASMIRNMAAMVMIAEGPVRD